MGRCYKCMAELPTGGQCLKCGKDNRDIASEQPAFALPCGVVINNRYVIGSVLGQGGFGVTYIAWDAMLETRVCIKEYFPEGAAMRDASRSSAVYWSSSGNAQALRQGQINFLNEARKGVKLRDLPSVVTVYDVFQENGTAYIVMEYIDGMTLHGYLKQRGKQLNELEIMELLDPVMTDLEEVHHRGIIHRDISPDNLMLRKDGKLFLLDIGAAKDLSRGSGYTTTIRVAKKGFSPAEHYTQDSDFGTWTDVYAMCATIVYCRTGKPLPEPMARLMGEKIDLSAFTPELARVLEKGLALKPEERIQTMSELQNRLHWALNKEPLEAHYQNAIELMKKGDKDSLKAAMEAFISLGRYQDAAAKAEECRKRLEGENPKKEVNYQKAITLMEKGDKNSLHAAWEVLVSLGNYRDAAVRAVDCRKKIVEIERQEKEHEAHPRLEDNYQKAMTLKAKGDEESLREALKVFSSLGTYRDAAAKVWECREELKRLLNPDSNDNNNNRDKKIAFSLITLACLLALGGSILKNNVTQESDMAQPSQTMQFRVSQVPKIPSKKKSETSSMNHNQLFGSWGEQQAIHNGLTCPFNLDKEIVNCTDLTMELTITEYTGYPFGNWYLYAKDLNDRWDHIENFRIEKEQGDGSTRTYEFHFDSPQSFKALAICMRDKGNEYSMNSSENFYVNS